MRPKYHISPEQGFLNDPNGLAQNHGKWNGMFQQDIYETDNSTCQLPTT